MPHARNRHIIPLVVKKLSFTPCVAIQGARQTGKSFIGREILPQSLPKTEKEAYYLSLDDKNLRLAAQNSPDDFIRRYPEAKPLIIDEAQKAPDLFDALKLNIDEDRVPGKFIILGSTEFSKLSKIRESLTGRMSRVRVYPFTVAESLSIPLNPSSDIHLFKQKPRVQRSEIHLYLERGGLPGLFAIRSPLEREQAMTDLIDLILFRDARYVRWFDPELGRDILEKTARLEVPNLAEISAALRVDARRVKRHLEVLKELFVIYQVNPNFLGTGKSIYFIYDCALARFLGAPQDRIIQTWFLNEQLSQRGQLGQLAPKIQTYFTQKGSQIDFVIESDRQLCAIRLLHQEQVRKTDVLILKKLKEKASELPSLRLVAVGPFLEAYKEDGIEYYPYEAVV